MADPKGDERKPVEEPKTDGPRKKAGEYEVRLGKAADGIKTPVSSLVDQLLAEAQVGAPGRQAQAVINEAHFHGHQAKQISHASTDGQAALLQGPGVDIYRNYLRNLVQTWCARFLEDRPSLKAYPAHAHHKDVLAAKFANIYLDHQRRANHDAQLSSDLALYAQLHGSVGLKVCWDPDAGPPMVKAKVSDLTGLPETTTDEEGNLQLVYEDHGPEGMVKWELVTIFDFYYGGSDTVEEADYVVFVKHVTEWEARDMLREAGLPYDHGAVEILEYTTPWGTKTKGVRVLELWHRPGPMLEHGLFARTVAGTTTECKWYPLDHGELPLAVWHINKLRGSPYGTSHVDDAIPVQRMINEQEEAKVETIRKTGVPRLVGLNEIIEEVEQGLHMIGVDGGDFNTVSQGFRYMEPPKANELVFGTQQEQISAMYTVFGLNEVNTGKDSVKSGTSAKQIAYLNRLDAQKQSVAMRNYEVFRERAARLDLLAFRQYAKTERTLRFVGEDGRLIEAAFRGADLAGGTDLHLEPHSGIEQFHAVAAQEAEEDLQMGKVSPAAGMERAETGLGQTMGQAHMRELANKVVLAYAQGQQVPVPPELQQNPGALLQAGMEARKIYGDQPGLLKLMQQAQMAAQQMQARRPAGPTARPQPPGPGRGQPKARPRSPQQGQRPPAPGTKL